MFSFKIDPRTGKPSPQPAAQQELNKYGPLPVRKRKLEIKNYLSNFFLQEHWEIRTLPDGRVYYIDHCKNYCFTLNLIRFNHFQ